MRKITLLMDHEGTTGNFKAGEVIEVTPSEYDFLMSVYMEKRAQQVAAEDAAQKVIARIKRALHD